jgi:hypothetical protein
MNADKNYALVNKRLILLVKLISILRLLFFRVHRRPTALFRIIRFIKSETFIASLKPDAADWF